MATGIIGLNENQLKVLEDIAERLQKEPALFDALLKSILFQNLGFIPKFNKYPKIINSTIFEQINAYLADKKNRENIVDKYQLNKEGRHYFFILAENHSLMMHILSGEKSPQALESILKYRDTSLCEAFFLSSIIMLSTINEDLVMEELVEEILLYRNISIKPKIISGKIPIKTLLKKYYIRTGSFFLKSNDTENCRLSFEHSEFIDGFKKSISSVKNKTALYEKTGKRIFSIERFLRLNGLYHIRFQDIVKFSIEKIPSKYIYRNHNLANIGYPTFEKELYEACRIYEKLSEIPEATNNFLLDHLSNDNVQIFGYDGIMLLRPNSNNIKLLLIALTAGEKFLNETAELSVSFIPLINKIEKRHDILNKILSSISYEDIKADSIKFNLLFDVKNGIIIRNNASSSLIAIDFEDPFDINSKIATMSAIDDIKKLRDYYDEILSKFEKNPFQNKDYRQTFRQAFETRFHALGSQRLSNFDASMATAPDFQSLEVLFGEMEEELVNHSFLREQVRLYDLYELNKNVLKRKKLTEIESVLSGISNIASLNEYWSDIKYFFKINRKHIGKEFEYIISRKFDQHVERIRERSS